MIIGINASFLRKPYTGIGQVTTHVLNELAHRSQTNKSMKNHKFFIYCEDGCDIDLPKNFHKRSFLPKFYKRDDLFRKLWWENRMVLKQARKDKCDVLFSLYQSATVNKYTDIKHVMLVHDVIPHIFPEYVNNLRKKIYWQKVEKGMYAANKIITVSEHTKIDLEKKLNIKAAKIIVDKIAVDPIFYEQYHDECVKRILKKYKLEKGYIYSGGGLEMRKNVDGTLKAYKALRDKWKDVPDLVISGKLMPKLSPMITDVEKLVKELKIEDHVHILGFVPQDDLPALYRGAKLFVFPSLYEGFGMPVLEAMSMGTPVLTADNSSLAEVGGETVAYVESEADEELCDKMLELLQNDEKLQQMSIDGKSRSEQFSWDKFLTTICDTMCQ
ncbi:MAG: glycosyltransferase family 1 protein [Patescibacteria group bacterium]|nr:glycosyltransferase family 1 protein [Patescibacteria group bacterium]